MKDLSDENVDGKLIYDFDHEDFGPDKEDYYTLVIDEEKHENKEQLKMPTIKTKKEMNLPELIEWGFENEVTSTIFVSEQSDVEVIFDIQGGVEVVNKGHHNSTFTVKVKEEITEDTVFEHMIEVAKDDVHLTWPNTKISMEKDSQSKEFHA